jgi:hypothetical protein
MSIYRLTSFVSGARRFVLQRFDLNGGKINVFKTHGQRRLYESLSQDRLHRLQLKIDYNDWLAMVRTFTHLRLSVNLVKVKTCFLPSALTEKTRVFRSSMRSLHALMATSITSHP